MKKGLIILLAMVGMLFTTCRKTLKVEKNVQDYYPKVKTLSVQKLPDGSVKVTGLVVSPGSTAVQYVGFCMDTVPNPDILSNQKPVSTLTADTFSCIYPGLDFPRKYYFRAWAANGSGYAIGSDVYADSVSFDTSLIPCRPPLQYLAFTSGAVNITSRYSIIDDLMPWGDVYNIHATAGYNYIDLDFGKVPGSGVYTSSGFAEPFPSTVRISVNKQTQGDTCKVYVRQVDVHVVEITICSLTVKIDNGYYSYDTYDMSTRFLAVVN